MFSSSVANVDGHPAHSSSMTLVRLFLNTVTDFYILQCSKPLFPYCAESLGWVSAPGMPLTHKNCITESVSSLPHVESGVAMLTLLW
jgi:hypothetical protein